MNKGRHIATRIALISAFALPSTISEVATAHPDPIAKLKVAFTPDHPGARTTIEFALNIRDAQGTVPPPITNLDLRLPAHMGIATTTLGQAACHPSDLIERGLHGCSANARIGFGDALAIVPFGPERIQEPVSINALMGPPSGEHLEIIFYAEGLYPLFAELVFSGIIRPDTNPFGERINTSVPTVTAWPGGPNVSLESFKSTIGPLHLTYHRQVNGKTIFYRPHGVRVPKHCPRNGYPFAANLTFEDHTHMVARYNVPCPTS